MYDTKTNLHPPCGRTSRGLNKAIPVQPNAYASRLSVRVHNLTSTPHAAKCNGASLDGQNHELDFLVTFALAPSSHLPQPPNVLHYSIAFPPPPSMAFNRVRATCPFASSCGYVQTQRAKPPQCLQHCTGWVHQPIPLPASTTTMLGVQHKPSSCLPFSDEPRGSARLCPFFAPLHKLLPAARFPPEG